MPCYANANATARGLHDPRGVHRQRDGGVGAAAFAPTTGEGLRR